MEQNYIQDIICKILMLQRQDFDSDLNGCDRPFLGPTISNSIYNTRPVQLYNRYTAEAWSISYTVDGVVTTSNVFRIEACEGDAVTVRLLVPDESVGGYANTNQFATILLSTVGAIRCLPDTYIAL